MQTERLVGPVAPVDTVPAVPPGATYKAKATRMDAGSYHEVATKELGPEFPQTPAARAHSVTREPPMDTLKPLPIVPFPSPDPGSRLAPPHKATLVRPPFRLSEMGEGRPDHRPLWTEKP